MVWLRYLWASPATLVGFACAAVVLCQRGTARWVDGVLEVEGGFVTRVFDRGLPAVGAVSAMTVGHVVLGRSPAALDHTRKHERVHVRQYERWGPFFIPAYLLASAWLACRGRDPYRENPFEIEAYREAP